MAVRNGPLEGVKVVELASWVAIPCCAAILGDWGARVIKVEPLGGGDPNRGFTHFENINVTDISFWWELTNRNKRSIAVDINQEQGREVLLKLIQDADVFLANINQRGLAKRGLDYDSLKKLNPKLIVVDFTGFGEVGPDKDKPGFDITAFWAGGGFMYKTGEPGKMPPTQPLAVGDQTSAMYLAGAVSTALYAREKTGKGQRVSLSLYHNAAWCLAWELQAVLSTNMEAHWRYQDRAVNPLWNVYQTKDGRWIQIACLQSDPSWHPLCDAIGHPELKEDSRFSSHQKREENNRALISIIVEALAQKTLAEWEELFIKHRIIHEAARSINEIANGPQAWENGVFAEVDHPSGKRIKLVNSPVKFSETPSTIRFTAPEYGQHTEEVLLEYGYSWDDIAKLKEQRLIP